MTVEKALNEIEIFFDKYQKDLNGDNHLEIHIKLNDLKNKLLNQLNSKEQKEFISKLLNLKR